MGKSGGQAGFDKTLQDGVLESATAAARPAVGMTAPTTTQATADTLATTPVTVTTTTTNTGSAPFNSGGIAGAVAALAAAKKGGKDELVLYQKVSIATGKQAGNP